MDSRLFTKTLNKGDVFVFPEGLIHFQFNPCPDNPPVANSALSSQNRGAITIANAVKREPYILAINTSPIVSMDTSTKHTQDTTSIRLHSEQQNYTIIHRKANLDKPRDTAVSKVGSNVTLINVMRITGLNTLGISLARID
ncbi:hypothetical protein EJB05_09575, partial [Eragrostis curvula]